jgi:hypothetical protein
MGFWTWTVSLQSLWSGFLDDHALHNVPLHTWVQVKNEPGRFQDFLFGVTHINVSCVDVVPSSMETSNNEPFLNVVSGGGTPLDHYLDTYTIGRQWTSVACATPQKTCPELLLPRFGRWAPFGHLELMLVSPEERRLNCSIKWKHEIHMTYVVYLMTGIAILVCSSRLARWKPTWICIGGILGLVYLSCALCWFLHWTSPKSFRRGLLLMGSGTGILFKYVSIDTLQYYMFEHVEMMSLLCITAIVFGATKMWFRSEHTSEQLVLECILRSLGLCLVLNGSSTFFFSFIVAFFLYVFKELV